MMPPDMLALAGYRALAAVVAIAMAVVIVRGPSWHERLFGAFVLVPFALRALGIK